MGPPDSHGVTRVPWYSGSCCVEKLVAYGTVTPFGGAFQLASAKSFESRSQSATPKVLLPLVWPLSLSLAATQKIDVSFSSSAYLDVSVQRVSPRTTMDSLHGNRVLPGWVAPFGNLRINTCLRFPTAYRS